MMAAYDFLTFKPQPLTLKGQHIWLRPFQKQDKQSWLMLREQSRDFLQPFEPFWGKQPLSDKDYLARLSHWQKMQAQRTGYFLAILARGDDRLLGGIQLHHIMRGALLSATLSYWIGKPFQRQGFMSQAVPLVTDFGFRNVKLHRIEACCLPENIASRALLSKSGFHEEGQSKRYLNINGKWRDHIRYALINDSWPRAPAR